MDLSWLSMVSGTGSEGAKATLYVECEEGRRYGMLIANLEHIKRVKYVIPAQETRVYAISSVVMY